MNHEKSSLTIKICFAVIIGFFLYAGFVASERAKAQQNPIIESKDQVSPKISLDIPEQLQNRELSATIGGKSSEDKP